MKVFPDTKCEPKLEPIPAQLLTSTTAAAAASHINEVNTVEQLARTAPKHEISGKRLGLQGLDVAEKVSEKDAAISKVQNVKALREIQSVCAIGSADSVQATRAIYGVQRNITQVELSRLLQELLGDWKGWKLKDAESFDNRDAKSVLLLLGGDHLFEWIITPVRQSGVRNAVTSTISKMKEEQSRHDEKVHFFRRFKEKLDKAMFELSELNKTYGALQGSAKFNAYGGGTQLLRDIRITRMYVAHLRKVCKWQENHFPYSKLYTTGWNKREECELVLYGFLNTILEDMLLKQASLSKIQLARMNELRTRLQILRNKLFGETSIDAVVSRRAHDRIDESDITWEGWKSSPVQLGIELGKAKLQNTLQEAEYVLKYLFVHTLSCMFFEELLDLCSQNVVTQVIVSKAKEISNLNYWAPKLECLVSEWVENQQQQQQNITEYSNSTEENLDIMMNEPDGVTKQSTNPTHHSTQQPSCKCIVDSPEFSQQELIEATSVLFSVFLENISCLNFASDGARGKIVDELELTKRMLKDMETQVNMLDELWIERERFLAFETKFEIRAKHSCSASILTALASQLSAVASAAQKSEAIIVTDIVADSAASPLYALMRKVFAKFSLDTPVIGITTEHSLRSGGAWGDSQVGACGDSYKDSKFNRKWQVGSTKLRPLTHLVATTGTLIGQERRVKLGLASEIAKRDAQRISVVTIGLSGACSLDLESMVRQQWPITMLVGEFNSDRRSFCLEFAKICQNWRLSSSLNSMQVKQILKQACISQHQLGEDVTWAMESLYNTALLYTLTMGNISVHHIHSKSFSLERLLYRDLCEDQALTNANNMRALYQVNVKLNRRPDTWLLRATLTCSVLQALLSIMDGNPAVEFLVGKWRSFVHFLVIVLPVLTSLLFSIQETMDAHTKRLKLERAKMMTEESVYRYRTETGKYSYNKCFEMEMSHQTERPNSNQSNHAENRNDTNSSKLVEIGGSDSGEHSKPQGDEYAEEWQVKQQQVLVEERKVLLADVFARRQMILAEDLKVIADAVGDNVTLVYPNRLSKYKTNRVVLDEEKKFDHFDSNTWESDQYDHAILSGDDYCWERLTKALLDSQKRVRWYSRLDLFSRITINLLGATGTILATLNFGIWVPATGAMVTAIGIWTQTERIAHGASQNRIVAKKLADIRTKWLSKPKEYRMRRYHVDKLVDKTENTIRLLFPEVEDASEQGARGKVKMSA